MNYTDKELIRASQIAYFDINDQVINDITTWIDNEKGNNNIIEPSFSLSELYEHSATFKDNIYDDISNTAKFKITEDNDPDDILNSIEDDVTRQIVAEKFNVINDIKTKKIGNWKVVSYVDNNTILKEGTAGKLVNGIWEHCA